MDNCQLIEECKRYFVRCGYSEKKPQGLLNPAFPDTFNPCSGHAEITQLANAQKLEQAVRWFAFEPVYRHLDAQKVGVSKHHLSSFEMFTHVDARPSEDSSKERIIEEILGLLSELSIDKSKLHVTVFDGFNLLGKEIPPDNESRAIWEQMLGDSKVHPLRSSKNIEYKLKEREQVGPRCEIFYERNGELIELGTTVFDNHIFRKGGFQRIPNGIYGSAVGIERLEMVINKYPTIWEVSTIKPILEIVRRYALQVGKLYFVEDELYTAADNLKSALLITAEGQIKDNKTKRSQRLTRLINDAKRSIERLNIRDFPQLCVDIAESVQTMYSLRYNFYSKIDSSLMIDYLTRTIVRE